MPNLTLHSHPLAGGRTSGRTITVFLAACFIGAVVCPAAPSLIASETALKSTADVDRNVDIGFLDFPTSGSPEAQHHFQRGVTILHSFGYKQAIEEFQKAQAIDPDFVMAYWGEALSHNHIFAGKLDFDSPRDTLARLGATPEERLAKAPTEREKDFLRAVEVHFSENKIGDSTPARRIAYMKAMQAMYTDYPGDDEVAAAYAVALIAAVRPLKDDTYRLSMKAGAIALDIFSRNPNHPGAAHYIIHAFDDPVHAPLALPAAERFADIASAVSHARHMPSHIFIQHGLWDRVSKSNDSAYQAALDLFEAGDQVNDMTHANDWGHYGDLQRADWQAAQDRLEKMEQIWEWSDGLDERNREFPERARQWMWARQVIETEKWETRNFGEEDHASIVFASGVSAVALGKMDHAKAAKRALDERINRTDEDSKLLEALRDMLVAKIEMQRGRERKALAALDSAVAAVDTMGPPAGTPNTIKPPREMYGEILLELGLPQQAITRYEQLLEIMPNRRLSVLGLAKAHEVSGNPKRAELVRATLAPADRE